MLISQVAILDIFIAQITDATACPDMWFVKRQVLILFLWLIYVFLLDVYCASDENISSYESESFTGSILVTCWLLLTHVDFSVLYHTVRGQSVIKLYVIYNMLEVQLIKNRHSYSDRHYLRLQAVPSFWQNPSCRSEKNQWKKIDACAQHRNVGVMHIKRREFRSLCWQQFFSLIYLWFGQLTSRKRRECL